MLLCVFLPPILYIFSIQSIEKFLRNAYRTEIENVYVGDTAPLFDGSISLEDAVQKNIRRYLDSKRILKWGVKIYITVTTNQGKIIYPPIFDKEATLALPDPIKMAAENYKLLQEGLLLDFNLVLEHNSWIANSVLAFYILSALLTLNLYYRRSLKAADAEKREQEKEFKQLEDLERSRRASLSNMIREKEELVHDYGALRKQFDEAKEKANRAEEEMIEEIVLLEGRMNENLESQKKQQAEIEALKEKLTRYENEKSKLKSSETLRKRFKAIYKNVSVQDRALSGYSDLTDNLKIKAEEIIQQLNLDPALVPVKRKVFGKKGRETVLEVVFSYKGRLYFRRSPDNRIEILAIGTKNVQTRDLEFLDHLSTRAT